MLHKATPTLFTYADSDGRPTVIYMATNKVNGHRYIGMTREPLHRRIGTHFAQARYREKRKLSKFHAALLEFGKEAFDFYVLETCADAAIARQREVALIEQLNPEYNVNKGGNGKWRNGREMSPAAKAALRNLNERNRKKPPMLGKTHSQETIAKLRSKTPTRYWQGKQRSLDTRHKISVTKKAKGFSIKQKHHNETLRTPVLCVPDGKAFATIGDAAVHYACAKNTVLRNCAKHAKSSGAIVGRFVYAAVWWQEDAVA